MIYCCSHFIDKREKKRRNFPDTPICPGSRPTYYAAAAAAVAAAGAAT